MAKVYPSQEKENRVIFRMSPEHRTIANHLANQWTQETGHRWSAKAVVEALLDLAAEGEIKPVSGARRAE